MTKVKEIFKKQNVKEILILLKIDLERMECII